MPQSVVVRVRLRRGKMSVVWSVLNCASNS
jgi:hypothetical protein